MVKLLNYKSIIYIIFKPTLSGFKIIPVSLLDTIPRDITVIAKTIDLIEFWL